MMVGSGRGLFAALGRQIGFPGNIGNGPMSTIPGLANVQACQQASVASQIAYAIASKRQDALKAQGDAAAQLLQPAVEFSKALGRGNGFDATA